MAVTDTHTDARDRSCTPVYERRRRGVVIFGIEWGKVGVISSFFLTRDVASGECFSVYSSPRSSYKRFGDHHAGCYTKIG